MILLIYFLFFFSNSKCISHIFSLSQITNLTFYFKNTVKRPYSLSPLIILHNTFINSQLTIANSNFFKIPFPVIQGYLKPLKIYQTKFSNCNTPIHLTNAMQDYFFIRCNYSNNTATIENVEYRFCFSNSLNGGCIYLSNCRFTILSCNFLQNTANLGGAIYSVGGKLRITNSIFVKNSAYEKGGAIFLKKNSIAIDHSQFILNEAGKKYGAVYAQKCILENFIQNNFYENFASEKYGGIFLDECFGAIISCSFKNNKAKDSNIGSSLAIIDNSEQMNIETCYFYDTLPYQLMISTTSLTIICDCFMAGTEANTFYILNKSSKINYFIINNLFNFKKMPEIPKFPLASLIYDILKYDEESPQISWNLIIIAIAMLIIILGSLIEWILPIIIWPNTKEKKGYRRQVFF